MNRSLKFMLGLVGAAAFSGLAIFLSAQFLFGKLGDLFTVPQSSLTYATVANWSERQFGEADKVTLLIGEASRETGNVWSYRAVTDRALLQKEDMRFGYYAGIFERITSIPGHSSCSINGKPRGRSISLSVNGQIVQSRSACRLSALDIADLWKRALPVTYHSSTLPREAHRELVSSLQTNPSVRLIGHYSDYSSYDKTVRIVLPTLWAEWPRAWEDRIDVRLEKAIADVLTEKNDVLELRLSERNRQNGEGPARPQAQPDAGSGEPSEAYLLSGDAGLRLVRNIDFLTPEIRIRCVAIACGAIGKVDFPALLASFRDRDLLQKEYKEGSPASANEWPGSPLNIDGIWDEGITVEQAKDILYGAYWIDMP